MQGKFVKKLTDDIFELRVKQFDRIFRVLFFYQPGMLIVITSGFQKKTEQTPQGEITRAEQLRKLWMKYRNHYAGLQKEREAIPEGVGPMRETAKGDKHSEIVEQRARKSATYRKTFARTLHQIDLALLVREMREDAGLTQAELAKKVGTTQSVIARLEDADYAGHSLTMLERIATACGVALKLHAQKNPISTAKWRWYKGSRNSGAPRTDGMPMKPGKAKPRMDHSGSAFDSFLEEEGIREDVGTVATKRILEWLRTAKTQQTTAKRVHATLRAKHLHDRWMQS